MKRKKKLSRKSYRPRLEIDWTQTCAGCGRCCGPVPMTPAFINHHKASIQAREYSQQSVSDTHIVLFTPENHCVFLTADRRCAIYEDRPPVCKLQGKISDLPCPAKKFYKQK